MVNVHKLSRPPAWTQMCNLPTGPTACMHAQLRTCPQKFMGVREGGFDEGQGWDSRDERVFFGFFVSCLHYWLLYSNLQVHFTDTIFTPMHKMYRSKHLDTIPMTINIIYVHTVQCIKPGMAFLHTALKLKVRIYTWNSEKKKKKPPHTSMGPYTGAKPTPFSSKQASIKKTDVCTLPCNYLQGARFSNSGTFYPQARYHLAALPFKLSMVSSLTNSI